MKCIYALSCRTLLEYKPPIVDTGARSQVDYRELLAFLNDKPATPLSTARSTARHMRASTSRSRSALIDELINVHAKNNTNKNAMRKAPASPSRKLDPLSRPGTSQSRPGTSRTSGGRTSRRHRATSATALRAVLEGMDKPGSKGHSVHTVCAPF